MDQIEIQNHCFYEVLGKVIFFRPLCHSVHRARGLFPSMYHGSHERGAVHPEGDWADRPPGLPTMGAAVLETRRFGGQGVK